MVTIFNVVVKLLKKELTPESVLSLPHLTELESNRTICSAMHLLHCKPNIKKRKRKISPEKKSNVEVAVAIRKDDSTTIETEDPTAALAINPKIGRHIPYEYIKRRDLGGSTMINLCSALKMQKPSIPQINTFVLEEQSEDVQLKVYRDGYHDTTAKINSLLHRVSLSVMNKFKDDEAALETSQQRIWALERQIEEKNLKIEKLEFQSDKREVQRKRRNKIRGERRKKEADSHCACV